MLTSQGTDLALIYNEELGVYDIALDEKGDLLTEDSFDTAILMSLFADRRASETEVPIVTSRRGWWGNECNVNPEHIYGSKLWLLYQARMTPSNQRYAEQLCKDALAWIIRDGHCQDIKVTVTREKEQFSILLHFLIDGNIVDSRYYPLWLNSGQINAV